MTNNTNTLLESSFMVRMEITYQYVFAKQHDLDAIGKKRLHINETWFCDTRQNFIYIDRRKINPSLILKTKNDRSKYYR